MPSMRVAVLMGIISSILVVSCSTTPTSPAAPGEMRLTGLRIPGNLQAELPYAVVVNFRAEGRPEIKRACFQWVTDTSLIRNPSLYCYMSEVQGNRPIGSSCWRWLAEGTYTQASPVMCSEVKDVNYEDPGSFVVNFSSRNVKLYYNTLEAYAEYVHNGQLKRTNKVTTRVVVEK